MLRGLMTERNLLDSSSKAFSKLLKVFEKEKYANCFSRQLKDGGEEGLRDSEEEIIHWVVSYALNVEWRNYGQLSSDFL